MKEAIADIQKKIRNNDVIISDIQPHIMKAIALAGIPFRSFALYHREEIPPWVDVFRRLNKQTQQAFPVVNVHTYMDLLTTISHIAPYEVITGQLQTLVM